MRRAATTEECGMLRLEQMRMQCTSAIVKFSKPHKRKTALRFPWACASVGLPTRYSHATQAGRLAHSYAQVLPFAHFA
eukprot:5061695-Amphidinium_carterae.2